MRMLPMSCLMLALLAGCDRHAPPAPAATAASPPPTASPAPHVEPVAPTTDTPPSVIAAARFDGVGAVRFGLDDAAFRRAWGAPLDGMADADCFHLTPVSTDVPAEFAFMFEQGRFVRYSTETAREAAPGGGRVGMQAGEIAALYPGRIEERPHKYVDGGKYLRIDDVGGSALVFEIDADGRVTEWRVGQVPQVDYVEGCS